MDWKYLDDLSYFDADLFLSVNEVGWVEGKNSLKSSGLILLTACHSRIYCGDLVSLIHVSAI